MEARGRLPPTVVFAPAAKVLIQVEFGGAVAELDVGQPLGDDAEKGGVQPDRSADDGDDDPPLGSIVGFQYPLPPVGLAGAKEPGLPFAPCLSPQLLPRSILDPVFVLLANRLEGCRRWQQGRPIPMVVKS